VTGELGETVMLPGKPRLSYDKLILFGSGPRASFSLGIYQAVIERMLVTLENLQARGGVVELPGRADELIPAEQAADILLAAAGREREHALWILVEGGDAKQRIVQHMIEERRRVRRVL
jgi:hypothetical protein